MNYSLAFNGWASITTEGGSLGTILIMHDGRKFEVETLRLIKLELIERKRKPMPKGMKVRVRTSRCTKFVKVSFTHPTGVRGVRLIQTASEMDQRQVKDTLIQEYLLTKGLSDDSYTVKMVMAQDQTEVVFKDLEEED